MGDKDWVKPDSHIAYDLATMQERLGWPRFPDPSNPDDVRNDRTPLEEVAYWTIFLATGRYWDHYPEIPPPDFFAQPKLAIRNRQFFHDKPESDELMQDKDRIGPEGALCIFSACVKKEAQIKREIVEGTVITWCPMCLFEVAPQEPTCLECNVNLEPVLRPRRLLAFPGLKVNCAAFIDELHQISRKRKRPR
jgi:hypothetical protein